MLRGVQFAARFEFTLDESHGARCAARSRSTTCRPSASGARFEKLLFAPRPSIGFALAMDLGVVSKLFPELQALAGCPQEPEWHPEGDVWVHTLQVIDQARTRIDDLPRPQQIAVMLGAVCHDFGKPATTALIDGRIRSMDHEEQGVAPATAFLDRLNVHSIDGYDVRRQVLGITAQHLKPGSWFKVRDEVGDGAFRRLAHKVDLELLARVAKSDCEGRKPGQFDCSAMDWFLERARALGVEHRPPAPILLGRHLLALGVKPGPRVGEILKAVYEQQMDGTIGRHLDESVAAARTVTLTRPGPYNRGGSIHARLRRSADSRRHAQRRRRSDAEARRWLAAGLTLHTFDGTIPQLRRSLDRSLDVSRPFWKNFEGKGCITRDE